MNDVPPKWQSTYEMRRRAPFHFLARAENARFAAYVLSHTRGFSHLDDAGHSGSPEVALGEAFAREASLALELIIKAVIAQRLEIGLALTRGSVVPASHHLPDLWSIAMLPGLDRADAGRLIIGRTLLMWAGRYPAPNKDEHGQRDDAELWQHATEPAQGLSSMFKTMISYTWEDISRIFSIASDEFWRIRREAGL